MALARRRAFLEPLESTSLALIQSGIERLLALLPDRGCAPALADEYNRVTALEHERLRDFLVLHYAANARHGEAFWDERRDTALPPMLAHKLRLFPARAVTWSNMMAKRSGIRAGCPFMPAWASRRRRMIPWPTISPSTMCRRRSRG